MRGGDPGARRLLSGGASPLLSASLCRIHLPRMLWHFWLPIEKGSACNFAAGLNSSSEALSSLDELALSTTIVSLFHWSASLLLSSRPDDTPYSHFPSLSRFFLIQY